MMISNSTLATMSRAVVIAALQKEPNPDTPAYMDEHYHRCVFCGANNHEAAVKYGIDIKPPSHDLDCVYLTALKIVEANSG
jgi:hypothetical protein